MAETLVQRLREQIESEDEYCQFGGPEFGYGNIFREAADEIERLTAEVERYREAMSHIIGAANEGPRFGPFDCIDNTGQPYQSAGFEAALKKARQALAGKEGSE